MNKGKVLVVGSNAIKIEVQGGSWGPTSIYLSEAVVASPWDAKTVHPIAGIPVR